LTSSPPIFSTITVSTQFLPQHLPPVSSVTTTNSLSLETLVPSLGLEEDFSAAKKVDRYSTSSRVAFLPLRTGRREAMMKETVPNFKRVRKCRWISQRVR
jgi:hypothetical protein